MMLAIFGGGRVAELRPLVLTKAEESAAPLGRQGHLAEPRPCAACGVAFRPRLDHLDGNRGRTCSFACRGIDQTTRATARVRVVLLSALTSEGQSVNALSGGARVDRRTARRALAALEAEGLAERAEGGRGCRWRRT